MVEKVLQLNKEKTVFWTLLGVLFICAGLYMFFINQTVHNVVSRQNLENEASKLTLSIGSHEFQYITSRNTVTLQLAYSLGFKAAENKIYISKKSANLVSYAR